MPRRIFRSRANQLAHEPESLVRITRSGRRGDSSQTTRWGLTGMAGCMARSCIRSHQLESPLASSSRKPPSVFWISSGRSALSVSAESPTRFTSIG